MDAVIESRDALERSDISYFVSRFPVREHWRILGKYFDRATFFDIETTGLSFYNNHPTVISAYRRGELYDFIYGVNMDDFLLFLDDCELIVSFNGSCFDIPFLERTFNIPCINRPHIDLRWVSYHCGFRGGLKKIERDLNIKRPAGLSGIDGLEAIALYYKWMDSDLAAGEKLVRYCRADVISSYITASAILKIAGVETGRSGGNELFGLAMNYSL